MNIIVRELRANTQSMMIWGGSIVLFVVMMFSEFSAYYKNPEIASIVEDMPEILRKAMSMAGANLTTVTGYLSVASVYFYVLLSVHAVLLGSSILSKEERDKTTEFFLVLPISREQVVFYKWIAAILLCGILNLLLGTAVIFSILPYEVEADFRTFMLLIQLSVFLIQLIFLSLGMFLAAAMKRYKKSGVYAVSILVALYILSILSALTSTLKNIRYVTPFTYFEANYIARHLSLDISYVALSIVLIVVFTTGTFYMYSKRDLQV